MIGIHKEQEAKNSICLLVSKNLVILIEKGKRKRGNEDILLMLQLNISRILGQFCDFFFRHKFLFISSKNVKKNWTFIYDPIFSCSVFFYLFLLFSLGCGSVETYLN